MVTARPSTRSDVKLVTFRELGPGSSPDAPRSYDTIGDVHMTVTAHVGTVDLPFRRLAELAAGEVLELNRLPEAPIDILANGTLIARGDVVIVDEEVATRISEVLE